MKPALAMAGAVAALVLGPFAPAQQEKAAKDSLPADLEQAFREFSREAAHSRREKFTESVKKRGKELADQVKLDPEAQAKLAEYYPRIVEATQADWQDRFQAWLRPHLVGNPDPAAILEQWDAAQMATNQNHVSARPDESEVWQEALAEVLTEVQLDRYRNDEQIRRDKLRKELQTALEAGADHTSTLLKPVMDVEIARLRQLAKLDQDRVQRLQAAADAAIATIVQNWRGDAEKRMLELDDEQLQVQLRSGFPGGFDSSAAGNQPKEQPVWTEALREILTNPEREQIALRDKELRARRSEALATVLVDALDSYFGFTGDQRERLRPLLAEPLLALPDYYFVPPRPDSYYSIDPQQLWNPVAELADEVLQPVLDETQRKRWREVEPNELARHHHRSSRPDLAGLSVSPEAELDELAAHQLVSRYLHLCARDLADRPQRMMKARVEALTRVAGLSPEQQKILRTAAKGVARELADNSMRHFERSIRSNLQHVEPQKLVPHLKGVGTPYFSERAHAGQDPALWTETVQRVLTPAQLELWSREQEAAGKWRLKAQAGVILTELEKTLLLAPEKREALASLVEAHLADYEEDLELTLSPKWHLEGYYSLFPFALIDEEKLTPFLDPEQIQLARGRNPEHFGTLVENIQKQHQQRQKKKQ